MSSTRQKIDKKIEDLNNTIKQVDLTIYTAQHLTAEDIFFLSKQETLKNTHFFERN